MRRFVRQKLHSLSVSLSIGGLQGGVAEHGGGASPPGLREGVSVGTLLCGCYGNVPQAFLWKCVSVSLGGAGKGEREGEREGGKTKGLLKR